MYLQNDRMTNGVLKIIFFKIRKIYWKDFLEVSTVESLEAKIALTQSLDNYITLHDYVAKLR